VLPYPGRPARDTRAHHRQRVGVAIKVAWSDHRPPRAGVDPAEPSTRDVFFISPEIHRLNRWSGVPLPARGTRTDAVSAGGAARDAACRIHPSARHHRQFSQDPARSLAPCTGSISTGDRAGGIPRRSARILDIGSRGPSQLLGAPGQTGIVNRLLRYARLRRSGGTSLSNPRAPLSCRHTPSLEPLDRRLLTKVQGRPGGLTPSPCTLSEAETTRTHGVSDQIVHGAPAAGGHRPAYRALARSSARPDAPAQAA
jgi:hypothetical protein